MTPEKEFRGTHGWLQFQFHWRNDADLVAGLPRYATTETDREVAAVTAETAPEGGGAPRSISNVTAVFHGSKDLAG